MTLKSDTQTENIYKHKIAAYIDLYAKPFQGRNSVSMGSLEPPASVKETEAGACALNHFNIFTITQTIWERSNSRCAS